MFCNLFMIQNLLRTRFRHSTPYSLFLVTRVFVFWYIEINVFGIIIILSIWLFSKEKGKKKGKEKKKSKRKNKETKETCDVNMWCRDVISPWKKMNVLWTEDFCSCGNLCQSPRDNRLPHVWHRQLSELLNKSVMLMTSCGFTSLNKQPNKEISKLLKISFLNYLLVIQLLLDRTDFIW